MKEFTELRAVGKKEKHKTVIKKKKKWLKMSTTTSSLNITKPPPEDSLISRQSVLFQVSFLLLPCTLTIACLFLSCTINWWQRTVCWRFAPKNPNCCRKDHEPLGQEDLDAELTGNPDWAKQMELTLLWYSLSEITWVTELRVLHRGQERDQLQDRSVHCTCTGSRYGEYF